MIGIIILFSVFAILMFLLQLIKWDYGVVNHTGNYYRQDYSKLNYSYAVKPLKENRLYMLDYHPNTINNTMELDYQELNKAA